MKKTMFKIGLLNYGKNHYHDYFGQYLNHVYLTIISGSYDQNFIQVINLKIAIHTSVNKAVNKQFQYHSRILG